VWFFQVEELFYPSQRFQIIRKTTNHNKSVRLFLEALVPHKRTSMHKHNDATV